jgi:chitinase
MSIKRAFLKKTITFFAATILLASTAYAELPACPSYTDAASFAYNSVTQLQKDSAAGWEQYSDSTTFQSHAVTVHIYTNSSVDSPAKALTKLHAVADGFTPAQTVMSSDGYSKECVYFGAVSSFEQPRDVSKQATVSFIYYGSAPAAGTIELHVSAAPQGLNTSSHPNAIADITYPDNSVREKQCAWGTTCTVSNAPFGDYGVAMQTIGNYQGSATPNSFTINTAAPENVNISYTEIPPSEGEIDLHVAAAPAGLDTSAHPDAIANVTYPDQSVHEKQCAWNTTCKVAAAPYGAYSIAMQTIATYQGTATPSTFTLNSATPQTINISYAAAPPSEGEIDLQVAAAPVGLDTSAHPNAIANVTYPDSSVHQTLCPWNTVCTIPTTPYGNYSIAMAAISNFIGTATPSSFSLSAQNQKQDVSVTYATAPTGSYKIDLQIAAAPKDFDTTTHPNAIVSITYPNSSVQQETCAWDTSCTITGLEAGEYQLSVQTIADFAGHAASSTITLAAANPVDSSAISYSPVITPTGHRLVAYWASWASLNINKAPTGPTDSNSVLNNKVTDFNLSFGGIDPSTLQVVGSDSMLDPTSATGWKDAPYNIWTNFKATHPDTKVLLAIGGATYHAIWTTTLTAANAEEIATNIKAAIETSYPVYHFDGSYVAHEVSTVSLDGVDLDVEAAPERLTEAQVDNVALLIEKLRALMPNKVISLTGLHTAADPASCQSTDGPNCSYWGGDSGSTNAGELIPLLNKPAVVADLDYVNIMAYDAGPDFKYNVAMANYANYVGKSKAILGLDFATQWGPSGRFLESITELRDRVQWTLQKTDSEYNAGGVMVWGLVGDSDPAGYLKKDQVKYTNEFGNTLN